MKKYKITINWKPTVLMIEAENSQQAANKAEERNDYIIDPDDYEIEEIKE